MQFPSSSSIQISLIPEPAAAQAYVIAIDGLAYATGCGSGTPVCEVRFTKYGIASPILNPVLP